MKAVPAAVYKNWLYGERGWEGLTDGVDICALLLEKYGDWEAVCTACGMERGVIECIDRAPEIMSLDMIRDIARALGMSSAELVQLAMDD